ncbi:MAG: orotidine-5'-phosphate decarboxylase [Acidimicrobiia bacterium]
MAELTPDPIAREHCVLALDVGDLDAALRVARPLAPWIGWMKVGLELYSEAGPAAFEAVADLGTKVFADLKFHDIPNTVGRASRAVAQHPIDMLNFHAAGGEDMMRAAVDGLKEHKPNAIALAVTVLTSEPDASKVEPRMDHAKSAGCDGVVCAGTDAQLARARGLRPLTPGIRLPGSDANDQARVSTPDGAMNAGAEWIVLGRTVTAAPDPIAAIAAVHQQMRDALSRP